MTARFKDPMDAHLYDSLFASKVKVEAERDRYRRALERIAAEDYRGNKPSSICIAEEALRVR